MGSMFSQQQPEAPQTVQPPPTMSEKNTTQFHPDTPVDAKLWQSLIELRNDALTKAWEGLDADGISSWHSKDVVLHSITDNDYYKDWQTVNQGYHEFFQTADKVKVGETQTFGTPYFTSKENFVESTLKDGTLYYMRETVLAWWRWEGEGAAWAGDLSNDANTGIRGWKIFEQHDYEVQNLALDSAGVKKRIFPTTYK